MRVLALFLLFSGAMAWGGDHWQMRIVYPPVVQPRFLPRPIPVLQRRMPDPPEPMPGWGRPMGPNEKRFVNGSATSPAINQYAIWKSSRKEKPEDDTEKRRRTNEELRRTREFIMDVLSREEDE